MHIFVLVLILLLLVVDLIFLHSLLIGTYWKHEQEAIDSVKNMSEEGVTYKFTTIISALITGGIPILVIAVAGFNSSLTWVKWYAAILILWELRYTITTLWIMLSPKRVAKIKGSSKFVTYLEVIADLVFIFVILFSQGGIIHV